MARSKTTIKTVLNDFLFAQISRSQAYHDFWEGRDLPDYITDNLNQEKFRDGLRPYQIKAVQQFIYLYETQDLSACKHLLFNMATGTGKTLIMACCILYLYEKGYRNFIFLVPLTNILAQAKVSFVFNGQVQNKYLFNLDVINMNGISVRTVELTNKLLDEKDTDIGIMFLTEAGFYNLLKKDHENNLTREKLAQTPTVILADEAHHLNTETKKKKSPNETAEMLNWESAVTNTIQANPHNLLLEFTATVELENPNIVDKYKNKIVAKYNFVDFNQDGYCKDVEFMFSRPSKAEDEKRRLVTQAVVLSQLRKYLFSYVLNNAVEPVVLFKSASTAKSSEDKKLFHNIVASLTINDIEEFFTELENNNSGKQTSSFAQGILSLRRQLQPLGIDDQKIVSDIKMDFAPQHTLIYNSKIIDKDNDKSVGDVSDELLNLDSKLNHYRAIFSVQALNEGWDVLSLFDIVHFDINESKKVKSADVQLIGRGARYYPFGINVISDRGGDLFENTVYETNEFKRKFDQTPTDFRRLAEQLCYHFIKTGIFHEELSAKLKEAGVINDGVVEKVLQLKPDFINSLTYQRGFVLTNRTRKRQKTRQDVLEATFDKIPQINTYRLYTQSLSDKQENNHTANLLKGELNLVKDFPDAVIRKALVSSGQNFFRFGHLKQHLPEINSIDEFIQNYLSRFQVTYLYEDGKQIDNLNAQEKLELLAGYILPEIKKIYSADLPVVEGSNQFRPVPLKYIFKKQKSIYFSSYPQKDPVTGKVLGFITRDEKAMRQSGNSDPELRLDIKNEPWYAYDESYGSSYEKKFVKYIKSIINRLQQKFKHCEIYLLRNELDYWIFNPKDGQRFSPDYLLFINDTKNTQFYYQCIFEAKGEHLMEKDKWKQDAILEIDKESEVVFDLQDDDEVYTGDLEQTTLDDIKNQGYKEIKPLGFSFFTEDDILQGEFKKEVKEKLLD